MERTLPDALPALTEAPFDPGNFNFTSVTSILRLASASHRRAFAVMSTTEEDRALFGIAHDSKLVVPSHQVPPGAAGGQHAPIAPL